MNVEACEIRWPFPFFEQILQIAGDWTSKPECAELIGASVGQKSGVPETPGAKNSQIDRFYIRDCNDLNGNIYKLSGN